MGQVVVVVVQLQARLGIAAAIVVVVAVAVEGLRRAALLLEAAGREGLEGLCLTLQQVQQLEVVQVEIQPGHQTEALAQRHLLTSSVVLVVVVVQVLVILLAATAAQAAIPVAAEVVAAQGTQSTPVLAAMVATAMSVS